MSGDIVYYTIRQLLEAIRLNGYRKANGSFITTRKRNRKEIYAACAIGQGALNLGITTGAFIQLLNRAGIRQETIYTLNDVEKLSIRQVVKILEENAKLEQQVRMMMAPSKTPNYKAYTNYQGIKIEPVKVEAYDD